MQTFVVDTNIKICAEVLDRQRLGKQRVECLQILNALTGKSKGWVNHPAVRMWKGYESFLIKYGLSVCYAWKKRGYIDNCAPKIAHFRRFFVVRAQKPWWWGGEIHSTHRSALLRKNLPFYEKYGWDEDPNKEYYWPV